MKNFLIIVFTFLLFSCSKKSTVNKPEKFIEKEQMENILYDLAVLQAVRNYYPQKLGPKGINYKTYIYKKYNIDSLQLVENNRYYTSNPEEYKKMFNTVMERIKNQKSTIDTLLVKEQKKLQNNKNQSPKQLPNTQRLDM
ncbi:MAG: DUF4296 domain-containing protein [Limnohabitans sp.]|nr:DUF4296 domain-containing protein [Limnohabitans sp.]